ncbi:Mor transcription activator family protein [Aeromonas rivuli]|uniref:Mor transcription activator family protein n=1 Tax=Aeromonas rivuli TaxID=648794 RepID=UPI0005AABEA5|nr:Mor transcription activator family protein [Aeromonas rivuli]
MSDKQEEQIDMFGEAVGKSEISTQLDRLLDEEAEYGWPETLRDLYSLIERTIDKHRHADELSVLLLSAICTNFGGARFYLPKGKSIEVMLRSMLVWKAFTGNNTFELSRQFKVSMREIQYILARMRKLESRARQRDLFAGTEQAAQGQTRKHGRLY